MSSPAPLLLLLLALTAFNKCCHGLSQHRYDLRNSRRFVVKKEPIHTLILCRHGDSIWNGGEPGCRETFTGWSDVPLSQKGIAEAKATGDQLSALYSRGIDVCCTSILSRAQLTAHYCLWGFAEKPNHEQPRQYVTDYLLNERHYGALQGYIKQDVENGMYGHDPKQVREWRRGWFTVPPLLEEDDPRRLKEVKKYQNFCGGPQNVPRGESLAMVAKDRIQPFLDQRLTPLLHQAALRKQQTYGTSTSSLEQPPEGGTGLVVAHANSLRALIGVLCQVEENPSALQKVEAMKIPTGNPLIIKYQETKEPGKYRVYDVMAEGGGDNDDMSSINLPTTSFFQNDAPADLPVRPLSCLPFGGGSPVAGPVPSGIISKVEPSSTDKEEARMQEERVMVK